MSHYEKQIEEHILGNVLSTPDVAHTVWPDKSKAVAELTPFEKAVYDALKRLNELKLL